MSTLCSRAPKLAPAKLLSATVTGALPGAENMTPNRKSFQMPVNWRIAATAITGTESGKRTWWKAEKNPAPSRACGVENLVVTAEIEVAEEECRHGNPIGDVDEHEPHERAEETEPGQHPRRRNQDHLEWHGSNPATIGRTEVPSRESAISSAHSRSMRQRRRIPLPPVQS
jgi:hypothetical protein